MALFNDVVNLLASRATGVFALAALGVSACGTSPPANYYTLDPADLAYETDPEGATVLGVGPIRVPDYLERPQLVTRRANAELKVHDYERWAEPVAVMQHRIVASNIDALLDDTLAVAYPYGRLVNYDYVLIGEVYRFDMDDAGVTRLELQWAIGTPSDGSLVPISRSSYETRGGNVDDPGSVAAAMSNVLEQFSRDVAQRFASATRR
jgi:uncharacterized lipoprotein YmbA